MPTECSAKTYGFARVESRVVVAAFDGGAVTSDAGGLLLGATDRAIKLVDHFADCFTDHRRADLIEHEVRTLVSQRVFGSSLGYAADDLSGAGAKSTGGRWNDRGVAMVYTSTTRALACLETMVHLNAGGLPLNRFLVEITVPEDVWAAADVSPTQHVALGWDAVPPGKTSIEFGTAWVTSQRSACGGLKRTGSIWRACRDVQVTRRGMRRGYSVGARGAFPGNNSGSIRYRHDVREPAPRP